MNEQPTETIRVRSDDWVDVCRRLQTAGASFETLFAVLAPGQGHSGASSMTLNAVFRSQGTTHIVACARPEHRRIESLVDAMPAAGWDERELHDVHGLEFAGHRPLRTLIGHATPLAEWVVPVAGADVHQVVVGPIHAGIIESGHFRFHVVGERIVHLDTRLAYKRRGLEAAAVGSSIADGIVFAQRLCAACAVTNTVAYAIAAEIAVGVRADARLRRSRTVLLELERLYNHLNDVSAICAGVGFAAGAMAYAALKERCQQLNGSCFGHRFLFGTVAVGAEGSAIDRTTAERLRCALREIADEHAGFWRELQFARSFQDRLNDVGILSTEGAIALGAVGPAARAAGVVTDVRADSPRLAYDGFAAVCAAGARGDVAARLCQRASELDQSFAILDDLLESPSRPGTVVPDDRRLTASTEPFIGRVESPRGRTLIAMTVAGGRLTGLWARTGSYTNWPVLASVAAGNLLPDFPLINKSFELCYACADR